MNSSRTGRAGSSRALKALLPKLYNGTGLVEASFGTLTYALTIELGIHQIVLN